MPRIIVTFASVVALGLATFTTTPSLAASPEATVGLAEVLSSVLQNGPEAILPKARHLEGESEALGVSSLPDLEIETLVPVRKAKAGNSAEVQVTQPFRPSDFGSRRSLAKSLRDIADIEARVKALDLMHKAAGIYTEAWVLQERENLYRRNLQSAKTTEASLKQAISEGRADPAEVQLFSAEKLRLDQRLQEMDAARQERLAELGRLAAISSLSTFQLTRPDKAPLPANFESIEVLSEKPASLRRLFQARADMAGKRLAVAKQDSVVGSFAPRLNLGRDYDSGSSSLSAGVVFTLPLWGRNRSEVISAEAEQLQAQSGLQAIKGGQFEDLLRRTYAKAKQGVTTAESYRSQIVPAFRSVHALAIKRFQNGQSSVLDLWTVRERLTDVEEASLTAVAASMDARVALETLIGNSLEMTP